MRRQHVASSHAALLVGRDSMALGASIGGDLLADLQGNPRLSARGCAAQQIEDGEKRCGGASSAEVRGKN
jgi:hypothetical protein